MSDAAIRVENLGKKYTIGYQREHYRALRDVLADSIKSAGRRLTGRKVVNPNTEEFWALQDISFEVERGDRVGIIGRNGAGKSTLLKILSRITEPTRGRVSLKGRVASLLEVGTGFHPELTGRENIYLNGAILGMSKAEIRHKFDEIVAFAEVEKFLDTPVKRYSSGMYVRLAFAVAAHLEPEILVVDEVLAVGDATFQKKCLGKMKDVGQEGRTVLFVSHNMAAVSQLCSQVLILERGQLIKRGSAQSTIESYLKTGIEVTGTWESNSHQQNPTREVSLLRAKIIDELGRTNSVINYQENFSIEIIYRINIQCSLWALVLRVIDLTGQPIFTSWDVDSLQTKKELNCNTYRAICQIPSCLLKPGDYTITLAAYALEPLKIIEYHENVFGVQISAIGYPLNEGRWGAIAPILQWETDQLETSLL
ncbi:MAG: ABC transporter ATP-binding protein [Cyanobacteriota bacterium]|nr:ABC transporter ATP-binding protein [Cyanobacteriota bacterium]